MATPHHRTFPTEMRSSGDGVRSALCSLAPGSSDPGSLPLLHKLHAAACAVLCGARACSQPLCSWRRANPESATARHAHGALLRSGCMLRPDHTSLTAGLFAALCGAPSGTPMGFRCPLPLRTHLPPAAQCCRGCTRPVRAPDVNSHSEMQPSFCPTLTCLSHTLVSLATLILNASMLLVVASVIHVTSRALT